MIVHGISPEDCFYDTCIRELIRWYVKNVLIQYDHISRFADRYRSGNLVHIYRVSRVYRVAVYCLFDRDRISRRERGQLRCLAKLVAVRRLALRRPAGRSGAEYGADLTTGPGNAYRRHAVRNTFERSRRDRRERECIADQFRLS